MTDSVSAGRIRRCRKPPKPSRDALIALHGQPVELDGEQVDQRVADHEHRHREAEHRKAHHDLVDQRALLVGGEHAERHGDRDREDDRGERQRERRLEPARDQFGDGLLEEEEFAEVAAQDVDQPDEELGEDRLVEPEAVADCRDLLGVCVVARDDRGRVAGREAQHQEHEHRDDQHHRQGGEQAAQDVAEHAI